MNLTPARWQEIKAILEDALELPENERADLVQARCKDDRALWIEVDALLNADNSHADLLEVGGAELILDNPKDMIGMVVGNYRILSELGTGGMGTVFKAERIDGEFDQTVALKLIKKGFDSGEMLRRFITERQILASLEHPNIARLVDGGTTEDGRPYLVMEYVEGIPIDRYCSTHSLSLESRLDLFRKVCFAVSFAHQKLVIHRDLKPQNILIDDHGHVKLLDFGIAKLLNSENEIDGQTQTFALTPEYASPEQIRGEPLSTATDIYSLGVILHELLTGSRPIHFDGKNIGEIVGAASTSEPIRPSAASSNHEGFSPNLFKGDLDNIVLKALRKDPGQRYASVEQFSEDVRRYLKGLPVIARHFTLTYRAQKFARRNPMVVGAVSLAFVILIGGIIATAYQARKANIERERAEARFNDIRNLTSTFMFEVNEAITKSPIKARELLVQRAIEYLDKLSSESAGNIELKGDLASAFERIGDIQSEIFRPFSGKTSEALLSHQKALALREEVLAVMPSPKNAANVSSSYLKIGNALMTIGKVGEARENYRRSINNLETNSSIDPADVEYRRQFARSLSMLGQAIVRSGTLGEALANYERSLSMFRTLSDEDPANPRYKRSIGIVISYIAFVKMEMGRTDEAAEDYRNWLDIERQLVANDPTNVELRHDLSGACTWYGVILSEQGKLDEANEIFAEGITIQKELLAADHENLGEDYSLADSYLEFGKAMARNELADAAILNLENALAGYRRIWQKDLQNLMTRHRIANTQRFLADAYFQKKELAKARDNYEQAHAVFKELTDFDPENIDWLQDLAMSHTRLGEFALRKRDRSAAVLNFRTALPLFERLAANSPDNVKRQRELAKIKELLTTFSD